VASIEYRPTVAVVILNVFVNRLTCGVKSVVNYEARGVIMFVARPRKTDLTWKLTSELLLYRHCSCSVEPSLAAIFAAASVVSVTSAVANANHDQLKTA